MSQIGLTFYRWRA